MEPLYKISSGSRISITNNILYVKDLTGNIGDIDYLENPDNPDTFLPVTNSTGYSVDTRLRSSVALFLFAYIRTTKGDKDLVVKTFNPITVSSFEVEFAEDGWYNFELFVIPVLSEAAGEGEVVYHPELEKVVEVVGTEYNVVDLRKLTIFRVTQSDKPVLLNAVRAKIKLNNKINQLHFSKDTTGYELESLQEDYDKLRILIEGTYGEFAQGNKYVFQKNVERITANHC